MIKFYKQHLSYLGIFIAILLGFTTTKTNAQTFFSFEASEGYELGDIQNGWVGGFIENTFVVSDERSTDGDFSFKMNNSGAAGFELVITSPVFTPADSDLVETSMDVFITNTTGGESSYAFTATSSQNDIACFVRFLNDNTIAILVRQPNGSFAEEIVPDFFYERETWFELKIENDFSGSDTAVNSYFINDQLIYTDAEGNNADNITAFFFQYEETENAGSAFIDNINSASVVVGNENSDTCSTDALQLSCGTVYQGDTSDNTDTGGENASLDEWFTYTGNGFQEEITLSLCTSDFDTRLTVYDACDGAVVATNDDFCGLQSQLSFNSDGETTYHIAVEGFDVADSGPFSLTITCGGGDACEDSLPLVCGDVVSGTTTNNTDTGDNFTPDEWFSYTGTGTPEEITISLCNENTNYNTISGVLEGECNIDALVFNDDFCGQQSQFTFTSDGITTYFIFVDGVNSETGNFTLEVSCEPLSVEEFNGFNSFSFYPNPANDILTIASSSLVDAITLYDILGREVISKTALENSDRLDISGISQGVYLMRVVIQGKVKTFKVVKE